MAESLPEQIAVSIKQRLETIQEGALYSYSSTDSFSYTPDAVHRVLEFLGSDLDESQDYLLFLRPEEDLIREGMTRTIRGEAPFCVLIAKKDGRASKSPAAEESEPGPIAATIINRCVADVRAALVGDVTLGGLVWNVLNGASTASYSDPVENWLVAKVEFTVAYDYSVA